VDDTLQDSGKSAGSFLVGNTTITTGEFTKISYDAKGLITGGTTLGVDDVPNLPFSKLTDTPSTLAGYGITDGSSVDINGLPEETFPVGGDYFPMYDDTSGANRKVSFTNIQSSINYPVDSVNTKTGAVTLDADDISDATTTNKFVTSAEKSTWDSKLGAVATATTGNFAGLNASGVLIDSGSKAADFAVASHNHDGVYELVGAVSTHESTYNHTAFITDVSDKADKVSSPTTGNFAGLDVSGNLTDSGSKAADFAAASHSHTASNVSDFDTEVSNNTTVTGKLDKSGGAMTGTLTTVTDAQVRNITLSTVDPESGDGSNGDVWIKYST